MHINTGGNIHNKFYFEVVDAITGEVKAEAFAENVVLNQALERLAKNNSILNYITLGKGTGTPTSDRVSLFTPFATNYYKTPTVVETSFYEPGKALRKFHISVSPSDLVGETITEVGFANGTGTSTLSTHAMLKDSEGNPISIAKTATDVVNVYATVYAEITGTNLKCLKDTFDKQGFGYAYYANSILMKLVGLNDDADAQYLKLCEYSEVDKALPFRYSNFAILLDKNIPAGVFVAPYSRKQSLRYEVAEGNVDINYFIPWRRMYDSGDHLSCAIAAIKTPNFQKNNMAIGIGDGVNKKFKIPKRRPISIVDTKVDGSLVAGTLYDDYSTQLGFSDCYAPMEVPEGMTIAPDYANGVGFSPDGTRVVVAYCANGQPSKTCLYAVNHVNRKFELLDSIDSNADSRMASSRFVEFTTLGDGIVTNGEFIKIENDKFTTRKSVRAPNTSYWHNLEKLQDVDVFISAQSVSGSVVNIIDVRPETPVITQLPGTQAYDCKALKISETESVIIVSASSTLRLTKYNHVTNVTTALTTFSGLPQSLQVANNRLFVYNTVDSVTALREYKMNVANTALEFVRVVLTGSNFPAGSLNSGLYYNFISDELLIAYVGSASLINFPTVFKMDAQCNILQERSVKMEGTSGFPTQATIFGNVIYGRGNLVFLRLQYFDAFSSNTYRYLHMVAMDLGPNIKSVEFTTPPAVGAPVTASVLLPYIPKDANHVVDFEVILTFGGGTP